MYVTFVIFFFAAPLGGTPKFTQISNIYKHLARGAYFKPQVYLL
jgi:hypothetical protein